MHQASSAHRVIVARAATYTITYTITTDTYPSSILTFTTLTLTLNPRTHHARPVRSCPEYVLSSLHSLSRCRGGYTETEETPTSWTCRYMVPASGFKQAFLAVQVMCFICYILRWMPYLAYLPQVPTNLPA